MDSCFPLLKRFSSRSYQNGTCSTNHENDDKESVNTKDVKNGACSIPSIRYEFFKLKSFKNKLLVLKTFIITFNISLSSISFIIVLRSYQIRSKMRQKMELIWTAVFMNQLTSQNGMEKNAFFVTFQRCLLP